ncbi:MAG: CPBP family glutamic-type intramembrane protease, partial [Thermoanaerobaculia bacterium]|nr:CPBP family glutamic-type intramembrane protease [Thermoanaerobaculia bacterium]
TVLFTLAHLSYQQPLMLVGIAVLSVAFAALVAWRQSIWAAVTAHAVFDLVQLLVVLPLGARALG